MNMNWMQRTAEFCTEIRNGIDKIQKMPCHREENRQQGILFLYRGMDYSYRP